MNKIKRILLAVLTIAALAGPPAVIVTTQQGCALFSGGYDPGADPVVVNAQQIRQISFDTVDTYLAFEKANRLALWKVSKEFKHVADDLRMQFPSSLKVYNAALDSYKTVRDATNKAALQTATANLAALGDVASAKMTLAKQTASATLNSK